MQRLFCIWPFPLCMVFFPCILLPNSWYFWLGHYYLLSEIPCSSRFTCMQSDWKVWRNRLHWPFFQSTLSYPLTCKPRSSRKPLMVFANVSWLRTLLKPLWQVTNRPYISWIMAEKSIWNEAKLASQKAFFVESLWSILVKPAWLCDHLFCLRKKSIYEISFSLCIWLCLQKYHCGTIRTCNFVCVAAVCLFLQWMASCLWSTLATASWRCTTHALVWMHCRSTQSVRWEQACAQAQPHVCGLCTTWQHYPQFEELYFAGWQRHKLLRNYIDRLVACICIFRRCVTVKDFFELYPPLTFLWLYILYLDCPVILHA